MKKAIVVYVPVIHQGYLSLFERYNKEADIFLIGKSLIKKLDPVLAEKLPRQLNAISEIDALFCLQAICIWQSVALLSSDLFEINDYEKIIMPVSDISNLIAQRIPNKKIIWDTLFLQWDWGSANAKKEVIADGEVTDDIFVNIVIQKAQKFADQSSDWWRHVGAVLVKDGQFLLGAYNQHMPVDEMPYVFGDPRWSFNAGQSPEICGAIHGENNLVAMSARDGIATKGCDLYVTTYPCPVCARTISVAGISRVFFKDGYSTLDSEQILKEYGVQTIRVVLKNPA